MLEFIRNLLWGPSTVLLIASLGITLFIKTRFRALKHPLQKFRQTIFSSCKNKSSMEAMFTALGGTIGVGNTIGVAGAIQQGGAGALVWMLIASFFGMVIKEAEIFLAMKFKEARFGFSGPMFYIKNALGSKTLSKIWCVSCIMTAFGMGNFSQSMSAVNAISATTNASNILISVFISFVLCMCMTFGLGGIKKIVSSFVPCLTIIFIISSIVILFMQIKNFPCALSNAFNDLTDLKISLVGVKWSLFATAMREGFSRGIFTNEAGLGSSSIVHSSSNETNPEKQAAWGVIEVFIDTVVICMLTGLMVLTSKVDIQNTPVQSITLNIFSNSLGKTGGAIYTISTLFFAIASMLAWFCYAECAMQYLNLKKRTRAIIKYLFILASFVGGVISPSNVLFISDIFNAVMLYINVLTIFLISNEAKSN